MLLSLNHPTASERLSGLCLFEFLLLLCFLQPVRFAISFPLLFPPLLTTLLDLSWCLSFACPSLFLLGSCGLVVLLFVFLLLLFVLLLPFQNLTEKSSRHDLGQLLFEVENVTRGHNCRKFPILGCCFDDQAEFPFRIFTLSFPCLLPLLFL